MNRALIVLLTVFPFSLATGNVVHASKSGQSKRAFLEKDIARQTLKEIRDLISSLNGNLASRTQAEKSLRAMEFQKHLVLKELFRTKKNAPNLESYLRIDRLIRHFEPRVSSRVLYDALAKTVLSSSKVKEAKTAFDAFYRSLSNAQTKELKSLQREVSDSHNQIYAFEDPRERAKAEKRNHAQWVRASDWLHRQVKGLNGVTFLGEEKGKDGTYFRVRIGGVEIALLLLSSGDLIARAPSLRVDLAGELPRFGTIAGGASLFHSRPVLTLSDVHLHRVEQGYAVGLGTSKTGLFGFANQSRRAFHYLAPVFPGLDASLFEQELDEGDTDPLGTLD